MGAVALFSRLVLRNLINDVTLKIVRIILSFSWDCSEHHRVIDLKAPSCVPDTAEESPVISLTF